MQTSPPVVRCLCNIGDIVSSKRDADAYVKLKKLPPLAG